jgi:adenosine deaminase CECR1
VGAEDRPNSIGYYHEELLAFTHACDALRLDIPFLFHAGESLLDTGGTRDAGQSNLYDALLLRSKRVGHGVALLRHPGLLARARAQGVCVELCPVSNEMLHLCRAVKQHPYPQLLAAGLPCSVNADNPALFRSSLAHEFYQVLVGSFPMNLHGWRQLAQWSLEHSCLAPAQKRRALEIWRAEWESFCEWIVATFPEWVDGQGELSG